MAWRRRTRIELSDPQRWAIERLAGSYSRPFGLVVRARIVLRASEGDSTDEIAEEMGIPRQIALKWLKRFLAGGLDGLVDRPRPGRPRGSTAASRAGSTARRGG